MNNLYKYISLYVSFIGVTLSIFFTIDSLSKTNIEFQKQILIKEAQTHFDNQQNTREWNANYGGIYVKPLPYQKPNPYLKENTLFVNNNLTLIKINPAWMTRQLSELSHIDNFNFHITSLNPLNPNNSANEFERRALKYITKTRADRYYELSKDNKFNYMGSLVTTKSCLKCHQEQGYKVGDIRGGISIVLNTHEYDIIISDIKKRDRVLKSLALLLLLSITLLIHRQIKNNENLQTEVNNRTKEIESTKKLLQEILDGDLSFLFVANDNDIIFTNKTVLDFFSLESRDDFNSKYPSISDIFEPTEEDGFLQRYIGTEHWTQYLKREQEYKNVKVLLKKDGVNRYFKAHTKEIIIDDDEILYLIILDEMTREVQEIQELEESASLDPLTKLFNRGKFNTVLSKEIDLCNSTNTPFSIIFLDIDFFKKVNDTYGHDVGDEVLIELSNLLSSNIRKGDFIFRWGGEEFAITLKSANKIQASILAQKIRKAVEDHQFTTVKKLTISLGITQHKDDDTEESFIKRVDNALYEAKNSGRNKAVAN